MNMKQTSIAIALAAASLSAHADLARVGPADLPSPAGHGFPLWYQDLNGTVLDLCLPDANDPGGAQANACLLLPGPPDPPYVFPSNFPEEAFYFRAVSDPIDMTAGKRAVIVLALEAAFSTGPAVAGDQVTFTRIRVTAGVPVSGTYTVYHPYGVETFPGIEAGVGNRDIVFSEDIGVARGAFDGALQSRFGPFLQRLNPVTGLPETVTVNGTQFLSDGVAPEFVTGSPFNQNYVVICGEDESGNAITLGSWTAAGAATGGTCAGTNLFALTGRLHDFVADPIPNPLDIYNVFYSRDAGGTQVNIYARDIKALPSQPDPILTVGTPNMPPVLMAPFGNATLGNYFAQLTDPSGALPGPVTVINSADVPPSMSTRQPADIITAASVDYDYGAGPGTGTLTVVATSSDKGAPPPALSLDGMAATAVAVLDTADPADVQLTVTGMSTPPDTVTVLSTAGGRETFTVPRNEAVPGFGAGAPIAVEDSGLAEAGGVPVTIAVTANDIVNAAGGALTNLQIVGPALPAGAGSVTVDPLTNTATYTPGAITGDISFQYTVSNTVGQSNPATVTVTVAAPPGGALPIANADGPVSVIANQPIVIDVLANDSGNGGTIDPATVSIDPISVTGGTIASVNTTTGAVTFNAGANPGTFGFDYTVANVGGNASPAAHVTVTIESPENITVDAGPQCKQGEWRVSGTSSILNNNNIQLYLTATVPGDLNSSKLGSAVPVVNGIWSFRLKGGPTCRTPISLRSSATGATRENIGITIR